MSVVLPTFIKIRDTGLSSVCDLRKECYRNVKHILLYLFIKGVQNLPMSHVVLYLVLGVFSPGVKWLGV
jgi:hypothetical protein